MEIEFTIEVLQAVGTRVKVRRRPEARNFLIVIVVHGIGHKVVFW